MGGVFKTLSNAWKITDLRKRILFTVMMLVIFRLGSYLFVPGLDRAAIAQLMTKGGAFFGFLNTLTGGAFQNATIFAMSITPYINASIIMQLLTVAIPKLEMLQKEGEEGRKIIGQYVRYGTVALAFLQAMGLYFGLGNSLIGGTNIWNFITITVTFTAGTAFLMWLGEQITEKGVGNGISLIIFTGILSRGPAGATTLISIYTGGALGGSIVGIIAIIGILAIFVAIIGAVIWVQDAERRIPVQYAKRVVGRKVYGGQNTHIPLKVNMAGVLPIIFAMSILIFPSTIIGFFGANSTSGIVKFFNNFPGTPTFAIASALLVIFFTFFYTAIQFNPIEIANNLKKNGGFVPGLRPGKPTSDYIQKVLNRITWFGAIFLAIIQVFPSIVGAATGIQGVWFAGPGVLIMVNVAMETIKQMESQMLTRNYKGFLE